MNTELQPKSVVNFYILPDNDLQHRLSFVVRLVEKALEQRLPTAIIGSDEEQLVAVDKLLWTVKPERFIAHEIVTEQTAKPLPSILLIKDMGQLAPLNFSPQAVIDLSYNATPINCPKVMLVANQHPDILPNARMKYQAYVNDGLQPKVYKL